MVFTITLYIVHVSLYPSNTPALTLSEVQETSFSTLPISHYDLMSASTRQEVHIHSAEGDSMAVSPNNVAFLLNTCLPIVSFYLLAVIGVGEYKRLLVSLITVNFAPDIPLVRALDSVLNRQNNKLSQLFIFLFTRALPLSALGLAGFAAALLALAPPKAESVLAPQAPTGLRQ